MEGDSKGAVKRSNPSAGGESNPAKMMKTGTQTNTGSYGTGQTSSTTVTTRKPQKVTNVKPDTSNPVIAHVQNILSSMVGTGLNPHTTKDAVSKLKEVLGPTPSNYYEQKVPKGKQLCRHYAKGYCQRGNTCSFLHSGRNQNVEAEIEKMSKEYARLLGHQNQKQKIHHIIKIKDENNALKKEVSTYREQSAKQKRTIQKLEEKISALEGKKRFDSSKAFSHYKENTAPLKDGNRK